MLQDAEGKAERSEKKNYYHEEVSLWTQSSNQHITQLKIIYHLKSWRESDGLAQKTRLTKTNQKLYNLRLSGKRQFLHYSSKFKSVPDTY